MPLTYKTYPSSCVFFAAGLFEGDVNSNSRFTPARGVLGVLLAAADGVDFSGVVMADSMFLAQSFLKKKK